MYTLHAKLLNFIKDAIQCVKSGLCMMGILDTACTSPVRRQEKKMVCQLALTLNTIIIVVVVIINSKNCH